MTSRGPHAPSCSLGFHDSWKPEPSLPGLTFCLTSSVCIKKMHGFQSCGALLAFYNLYPGPGRAVTGSLAHFFCLVNKPMLGTCYAVGPVLGTMAAEEDKTEPCLGTSLAVQWLRLHTSTAGGAGSTSGQGTKILHAAQCRQSKNKNRTPP